MAVRYYRDFAGDEYMEYTCDFCQQKEEFFISNVPAYSINQYVKFCSRDNNTWWWLKQDEGDNLLLCSDCYNKYILSNKE